MITFFNPRGPELLHGRYSGAQVSRRRSGIVDWECYRANKIIIFKPYTVQSLEGQGKMRASRFGQSNPCSYLIRLITCNHPVEINTKQARSLENNWKNGLRRLYKRWTRKKVLVTRVGILLVKHLSASIYMIINLRVQPRAPTVVLLLKHRASVLFVRPNFPARVFRLFYVLYLSC